MESIREKIKKLLAKAEGTNNVHEAEIFAKKATELMAQYAIERGDLMTDEAPEQVEQMSVPYNLFWGDKKEGIDWHVMLWGIIARFNMGFVLDDTVMRCIKIYAEPSYATIIQALVLSLLARLRAIAKEETKAKVKAMKLLNEKFNPNAFKRAFLLGAVRGIADQLKEQKQELEKEYTRLPAIITNNSQKIKIYLESKGIGFKSSKASSLKSKDGLATGYDRGKNMNIGSGINIGGASKTKLLN